MVDFSFRNKQKFFLKIDFPSRDYYYSGTDKWSWDSGSSRAGPLIPKRKSTDMLKIITLALLSAGLTASAVVGAEDSEKATPPTDAQIAKIVVVANTVDVKYGEQAVKKTKNPDVKAFAETMIRDHSAVNEKAIALVEKLGVTPEDSETSKSLDENGKKELERQKALEGAEFDKSYVDNEVSYHEAVIAVLDESLIPSSKNEELKALLKTGRPIFVAHLEHAKNLQKELAE